MCFQHSAPADLNFHSQFFGAPVEFNHDLNALICRASDLDVPVPMADPVLAGYARKYLETINISREAPMDEKVRQLISVLLPTGRCTVDQVARHLGVDRRTVHRKLALSGESFSSLTTAARCELAARYVGDSDRSLSDVSDLLGFAAPSGFSRWFTQQFGCSPSAWRRKHTADYAAPTLST